MAGLTSQRYRTHTCGGLRKSDGGNTTRISGWVHRVRDHGGVLFIDLRDHYGITQVVADPDSKAFKTAEAVRSEWVIRVDGKVRDRPAGTVNADLPTGEIEVYATEIEVLSEAKEIPVPVFGEPEYPEDMRLTYRFLDLRRETLHGIIMKRLAITGAIRRRMHEAGFNEFPTPILTASSPEGARDFLVPSRLYPGKFYALPQAPQQYKQLLMISGFDRYFQIAPCFRDEDPRADRLPGEFYQLDVEMSFVEQEDIFGTMEPIITAVFQEFAGDKKVDHGWQRIPYDTAIQKYGSDKPDLRNPIEMADVTEHFRGSGFKVFAGMIEKDPKVRVWAIPAPKGGSRAFCDAMNVWAQKEGQPGLGYIMWRQEEGAAGAGPIAKNIGGERAAAIMQQMGLAVGDACFFTAGDPAKFYKFAGLARDKVGRDLKLIDENRFAFAWIVDFPFYEWNEEDKKIDFSHNPFSMPKGGREALEAAEKAGRDALLSLKANQYDIVCNGYEIASGSVRNHLPETMVKAFEITGLTRADVESRFGGLYRAFQYGAPPHGGCAAGIERMVMLLTGCTTVRDVALFPMNQQANDLLMGAPAEATPKQLKELHLRIAAPIEKKKGDGTVSFLVNRLPEHRTRLDAADAEVLGVAGAEAAERVTRARPAYAPTPLVSLPAMAAELGLASLHVKDEGPRFGLGSFKALGGGYAVTRLVLEAAEEQLGRAVRLDELQTADVRGVAARMTFACATDGNHGRSVAQGAQSVGARSVIFIHSGVSAEREAAIARFGAEMRRVDGTYDESVAEAARVAEREGWITVSDTAWPGYERIPGLVMQGYTVLLREALAVMPAPPTHVFVQAGVGGIAAALAGHLAVVHGDRRPTFVVVEPARAACIFGSAKAGRLTKVDVGEPTVMAMLDCYEPSLTAWRVLSRAADAFMTLDEDEAVAIMNRLARPKGGDPAIVAGESGGVGLGGLVQAAADAEVRKALGLDASSRVFVVNTEGATDPGKYRELVGMAPNEVARGG